MPHATAFDILAAKDDRTVRIRVKTKSEEYTDWQWAIRKDGTIFKNMGQSKDFTVLVNLTVRTADLRFFVVPTSTLNRWLVEAFDLWVNRPGKHGRAHDPSNKKRHLNSLDFKEQLVTYLHNWDQLWK